MLLQGELALATAERTSESATMKVAWARIQVFEISSAVAVSMSAARRLGIGARKEAKINTNTNTEHSVRDKPKTNKKQRNYTLQTCSL
jgi:hypothetical protein